MRLNTVTLGGNLVEDLKSRQIPNSDVIVVSGKIAVERKFKSRDAEKPETDFIIFECRQATAANVLLQYTKKGSEVILEGEMRYQSWQDKENQWHNKTWVDVNRVHLTQRRAVESTDTVADTADAEPEIAQGTAEQPANTQDKKYW